MTTQAKEALVKAWTAPICLDDIIQDMMDAVQENCQPEDVFTTAQLSEWAENNGFTKSDT